MQGIKASESSAADFLGVSPSFNERVMQAVSSVLTAIQPFGGIDELYNQVSALEKDMVRCNHKRLGSTNLGLQGEGKEGGMRKVREGR